MKNLVCSLMTGAALLSFAACTNDDVIEVTEQSSEEVAQSVVDNLSSRVNRSAKVKGDPALTPQVNQISYAWNNPLEVLEIFPEFVTPQGIYDNFLFVSNGEPFDLVMLYSNGGYRHQMGIYWYDEDGDCHEMDVWDEFEELSKKPQTWYNANGAKSDVLSRLSDDAGAYTIQLPKGTKFGFYNHTLKNDGNKSEVVEGVRLDPPAGPVVDCIYKFYSEAEKNWNHNLLNKDGNLACQAMCTNVEDWTLIGFEDISLTWPSCDKDFNDCVFAMSPRQIIDGEPQTDKVEGSVETNLSVADKGTYDQVKLSMHVRANTDVKIVLPIADPVLADDFAIVAKHDVEASYSEAIDIADQKVELVYSLTEKGYLQIETKGINQQILDYCNNHYADGLTFECNLGYGKFVLESEPTISFTREPVYYLTSCVNNSSEANDYEIVWREAGEPIYVDPTVVWGGTFSYTHSYYSLSSLADLQSQGWLKKLVK